MIRISPDTVKGVQGTTSATDLCNYLQGALRLEHATIPPYLTARFSIKSGTNTEVRAILGGIFMDEMLHMAIVANVINAIGGHPVLNAEKFIPTYPSRLPMSIDPALVVGLKKMSKELVLDTFMSIEEPENPEEYPVQPFAAVPAEEPVFATVGQFYAAVIDRIETLGDSIFTGKPELQFTDEVWFPDRELFPVTDAATAVRALRVIVEQGEGTLKKPINADGDVAHYYRFQQIVKGRKLVPADNNQGYAFAGDKVELRPADVINIVENSKASMYAPESPARQAVDEFNATYSRMLRALHEMFSGNKQQYDVATGAMTDLTTSARTITSIEIGNGVYAAPSFEFIQTA